MSSLHSASCLAVRGAPVSGELFGGTGLANASVNLVDPHAHESSGRLRPFWRHAVRTALLHRRGGTRRCRCRFDRASRHTVEADCQEAASRGCRRPRVIDRFASRVHRGGCAGRGGKSSPPRERRQPGPHRPRLHDRPRGLPSTLATRAPEVLLPVALTDHLPRLPTILSSDDGDSSTSTTAYIDGLHGDTNRRSWTATCPSNDPTERLVERTHEATMSRIKAVKKPGRERRSSAGHRSYANRFGYNFVLDFTAWHRTRSQRGCGDALRPAHDQVLEGAGMTSPSSR